MGYLIFGGVVFLAVFVLGILLLGTVPTGSRIPDSAFVGAAIFAAICAVVAAVGWAGVAAIFHSIIN
jgi:hypothetical protein